MLQACTAQLPVNCPLSCLQYPDEPGVDTWAAIVEDCLRERQLLPASA